MQIQIQIKSGSNIACKKEVNKVSKARMRELMLDIQMIVPTGSPMGDGRGIRELLFWNLFQSWKNALLNNLKNGKLRSNLEIPICPIWKVMLVGELFSSLRSCFSECGNYSYVSFLLFSLLFFTFFVFPFFSLLFSFFPVFLF